MDFTSVVLCVVVLVGFQSTASSLKFDEETKRHYIYWDPTITEIIKDPTYSLKVEMGHFMDIVCPLTNLGITDDPEPPILFDLYNVTKDGFRNCDPTGGKLIFACSLPDQENKLTIKFQSISPSPFGFRFQECAEYYFLAVKRLSPLKKSSGAPKYECTEETERLRIKVGCSHDEESDKVVTTTRKTTTEKPKSFITRIKNELDAEKNKENEVVVPEITDIPKEGVHSAVRSDKDDGDGNGASRTAHFNVFSSLFFAILSLVWISIQNSSS